MSTPTQLDRIEKLLGDITLLLSAQLTVAVSARDEAAKRHRLSIDEARRIAEWHPAGFHMPDRDLSGEQ